MADGNFKANHVRQKNSNADIWLWDGAGMAPNQAEYEQFLQAAIEQLTVGTLPLPMADPDPDVALMCAPVSRRLPAKKNPSHCECFSGIKGM
jgi:hypothetical protein